MSAVIIMAPVVVAAWPVISAAVVGAVGAMGYAAVNSAAEAAEAAQNSIAERVNSVDIEIENSEIAAENMAREEELVFTKDDVTVTFRRDIRGKLKICVTGKNRPDSELERIGTEISQKVTQQYIYNRVVSELKSSDFNIVDQEVTEDETIKIQIRNWQ